MFMRNFYNLLFSLEAKDYFYANSFKTCRSTKKYVFFAKAQKTVCYAKYDQNLFQKPLDCQTKMCCLNIFLTISNLLNIFLNTTSSF